MEEKFITPSDDISGIKPLYLLADSRLLFSSPGGQPLFSPALNGKDYSEIKAAYIGVANDDDPVFYEMFVAAMNNLSITNCMQITSRFADKERRFLQQARLILLSGGDVSAGWRVIKQCGINELLLKRYYEGALIVGVSAGAVHLGLFGTDADHNLFETLKLAPLIIDVHDEKNNWESLQSVLKKRNEALTAIGIPAGGGLVYHPDHSLEALARPLHEFRLSKDKLKNQLIFPGERLPEP